MKKVLSILVLMILWITGITALTGFNESALFVINDETLPVEMSSFTIANSAQGMTELTWVTQTESNLVGYYVYRASIDDLYYANRVSNMISATNTSNQQVYKFFDDQIELSGIYYYWLQIMELNGEEAYHGPVSILVELDSAPGTPDIPFVNGLKSIYPNPFNPSTSILYQINNPASVRVDIFNARGQLVNTFEKAHSAAGQYQWLFHGKDTNGRELSSGVYQVVMTAGKSRSVQKMVLMK